MRIGQTSAVNFVSRTLTSAIGFFATLYLARVVGSEVLGIYFLLQSAVAWITILIDAGLSKAIAKRMSEGREPGMYFNLGLLRFRPTRSFSTYNKLYSASVGDVPANCVSCLESD